MNCPTTNVDLLMHCSRKIVRRLNKLDHLRFAIEDEDIYVWVQNVIKEINYRLETIIPNSNWQIPIQRSEESTQRLSTTLMHLDRLEIYRHSCVNLKAYILCRMHQKLCADPRFERLSYHSINIPNILALFEYLILPNREEMIRARQLYDYFREFSQKLCPDLLSDIDHKYAFGIRFASQSAEMKKTFQDIRDEAERDKQAKREEFYRAKQRYDQLRAQANELQCQCENVYHERTHRFLYKRKCERCKLIEEANSIRMAIYECPIPENEGSALAVVFELQMPAEIRYYREILWQFVNRPCPKPSHTQMHEWLWTRPHASKLTKFYTGPSNCKVKLVSSIKSLTETHYANGRPVGSTFLEQFLHPNHLTVEINPTRRTTFENECRILTAQLEHPNYKLLQFAVNSTKFEQNRVIAESIRCPLGLNPVEFVEFGSFSSGHHLQWWNLLSALELDSLSIDEECSSRHHSFINTIRSSD